MIKKTIFILALISCFIGSNGQINDVPNQQRFEELAIEKAGEFSLYIGKIASKSSSLAAKESAIQLALKLFIHDTVTIQVSFCTSGGEAGKIYTRPLKDYLRRLSILNYDKVEIKWFEIVMVEKLRKGSDGNYYGIISIAQKFIAQRGEYEYSDVTTKTIEVVLKPYKKPNDQGEDEWKWDIFLSNVNIEEPCL